MSANFERVQDFSRYYRDLHSSPAWKEFSLSERHLLPLSNVRARGEELESLKLDFEREEERLRKKYLDAPSDFNARVVKSFETMRRLVTHKAEAREFIDFLHSRGNRIESDVLRRGVTVE